MTGQAKMTRNFILVFWPDFAKESKSKPLVKMRFHLVIDKVLKLLKWPNFCYLANFHCHKWPNNAASFVKFDGKKQVFELFVEHDDDDDDEDDEVEVEQEQTEAEKPKQKSESSRRSTNSEAPSRTPSRSPTPRRLRCVKACSKMPEPSPAIRWTNGSSRRWKRTGSTPPRPTRIPPATTSCPPTPEVRPPPRRIRITTACPMPGRQPEVSIPKRPTTLDGIFRRRVTTISRSTFMNSPPSESDQLHLRAEERSRPRGSLPIVPPASFCAETNHASL